MSRRGGHFVGTLLILAAAVIAIVGYGWHRLGLPLDRGGEPRVVEIERGLTLRGVRDRLVAEGILSPRVPFVVWGQLTGADRRIKSGVYELSPAQSPRELLAALVDGHPLTRPVTLPEGMILARILPRLAEVVRVPEDRFWRAARDTLWLKRLGLPIANLEGYLFPETYRFERGTAPTVVLETMVSACQEQLRGRREARARTLNLTPHEVLTLASIVEAETALEEERRRIAAVYHNRLRRGMALQADPTVAYATGRVGQRLWEKHLAVDSPYNTYLHKGLPPGPICSPGAAAIDAVLWPLEGCRDLYFVARGDGGHVFSRTLEEHNRARQRVRPQR